MSELVQVFKQDAASIAVTALVMQVYEPPRYMSVNTAIEQLLEIEESRGEGAYGPDTLCVGLARLGADCQSIVAGTMW